MGATGSKEPAQITINSADADVPIIPPIILLVLLVLSAGLAKTMDRFRFLPDYLASLPLRCTLFAAACAANAAIFLPALEAMHEAGSGVAFTPTAGIATTGPFATTRNPFYCLLIFAQVRHGGTACKSLSHPRHSLSLARSLPMRSRDSCRCWPWSSTAAG